MREFIDFQEVTEQNAVNCTIHMSGEKCNCNDFCVVRAGEGDILSSSSIS